MPAYQPFPVAGQAHGVQVDASAIAREVLTALADAVLNHEETARAATYAQGDPGPHPVNVLEYLAAAMNEIRAIDRLDPDDYDLTVRENDRNHEAAEAERWMVLLLDAVTNGTGGMFTVVLSEDHARQFGADLLGEAETAEAAARAASERPAEDAHPADCVCRTVDRPEPNQNGPDLTSGIRADCCCLPGAPEHAHGEGGYRPPAGWPYAPGQPLGAPLFPTADDIARVADAYVDAIWVPTANDIPDGARVVTTDRFGSWVIPAKPEPRSFADDPASRS